MLYEIYNQIGQALSYMPMGFALILVFIAFKNWRGTRFEWALVIVAAVALAGAIWLMYGLQVNFRSLTREGARRAIEQQQRQPQQQRTQPAPEAIQ